MIFLVDYNLDGYAVVFLGILTKLGWLEFLSIRFVTGSPVLKLISFTNQLAESLSRAKRQVLQLASWVSFLNPTYNAYYQRASKYR